MSHSIHDIKHRGSIHDVKRKKVPLETKAGHFRTWKSGKKWIYGAAVLSLTAGTVAPIGNLAFLPKVEIANAATTSSGTLASGSTSDTGGHSYSGTEFASASNYQTYGKASVSGNTINLVSNTGNSVGVAIFNGSVSSISAAAGFSLSAQIIAQGTGLSNFTGAGDSLGVILSGASKAQLAANAQAATATNSGLGIRGLPNTVFLGRDLYSNLVSDDGSSSTGVDGTQNITSGWIPGGGNMSVIRSTDGSGNLLNAQYPNGTTTGTQNGTAWMQAPDTNALGISVGTATENMTVKWVPDATNTAPTGFTSGTLTYTLAADKNDTLTTHTNLQNSLTIGFVGGTGGNYGNLSVNLSNATLTGTKGTEPLVVNYVNSVTKQAIPSMNPSTITANVNDTVGVALSAPTSSAADSNTYTYVAPAAPTGYKANSATTTTITATNPASSTNTSATTVQNFIQGTSNPNVINVAYTPNQQTVSFNWAKATGTALATLPTNVSYGTGGTTADTSVVTDNPFSATTSLANYATALTNAVPAGYNITSISNGTSTYTGATTTATLANFKAANPTVGATTALNTYTVTLTANQANIAGSFTFVDGTPGFTNSAGATTGPAGSLTLNSSDATAILAANVGDTLAISKTNILTSNSNPLGAAQVTVSDTTNSNVTPAVYTAPLGYYIVGYSYAGGKPVALTDSNTTSPTSPTKSSVIVASSTDKIQFYLAPYSGYQTTAITTGTSGTATYTMTSAGGTATTQTIANTNGAQPKVFLETTTDGGVTATPGVKLGIASGSVAAGTYKAFGGTGLFSGNLGNTINQPYGFVASQGQTYASMKGVSGTNTFPTTNPTLAIPGYTIVGVRHSNSTTDIPQSGINGTVSTNMKQYASMEAALAGNDQYFDYPYNTPVGRHDFTSTTGGGIDQFAVLYQAIQPTLKTKNIIVDASTLKGNGGSVSLTGAACFTSFTTSTNTTPDSSFTDFYVGGSSNNQAGNPASYTGPTSGSTSSTNFATIKAPGTYTVTYDYIDLATGAEATAKATITVVGAYGFCTEVPQGAAITGNENNSNYGNDGYTSSNAVNVVADNTPWTQGQGLKAGATLSQGTVSNLSAVDPEGNSITPNLQLSDIVATPDGKVTIASGKLNQPGTYSFDVTYTYTTSDGLTQTVVAHDQITVDPPFSLPFTGGEGLAMIGGISAVAFIAAVALYATKRKKTEEES